MFGITSAISFGVTLRAPSRKRVCDSATKGNPPIVFPRITPVFPGGFEVCLCERFRGGHHRVLCEAIGVALARRAAANYFDEVVADRGPEPVAREIGAPSGIGAIARLPSRRRCQKDSIVLPMGETIPIPVTATCSMKASFTKLRSPSCYEHRRMSGPGRVEAGRMERGVNVPQSYRLVRRDARAERTVVRLRSGATFGGDEIAICAGPCGVESAEQLDEAARAVAAAGANVLRGGAYKPRTSPYSFQGLGEEGLKLLALRGRPARSRRRHRGHGSARC